LEPGVRIDPGLALEVAARVDGGVKTRGESWCDCVSLATVRRRKPPEEGLIILRVVIRELIREAQHLVVELRLVV
jgi:hypothetical protein